MLTYPPIDVKRSDLHDEASARFVLDQQLVSGDRYHRFLRIGCGTFARATYPDSPGWVVQLASDLTSFLFTFDDYIAEGEYRFDPEGMRRAAGPYLALVRGEEVPLTTVYARALAQLVDRGARHAPAGWRARLASSFEQYVWGCSQEAVWRRLGRIPSPRAYLELRRGSVAVNPMMDLMELGEGRPLTDDAYHGPVVQRLRELGSDLSAYVNDIQSVEKEEAAGEVCNAIIVAEHHHRLSRPQALEAVARRHNEDLGELLALEASLARSEPGSPVATFARSVRQFVHGHYGWILSSRRYIAVPGAC